MKQPDTGFQQAQRVHGSILARSEKRLLIWLAEHSPKWLNSDHLTLLGLFAMALAGTAYALSSRSPLWLWGANLGIFLNWLGDSMDGTLARVRNAQRPKYGFYVDHVVDAICATMMLIGLGLSPWMSFPVAIALLIVYLLLAIESYLATYTIGDFHISHFGFGPTELRILLVVGNLFLLGRGGWADIAGQRYLMFDVGGVIGAACLGITFLIIAWRNTLRLYREETKR
jgi:archaetidylinositol phosphate synthase